MLNRWPNKSTNEQSLLEDKVEQTMYQINNNILECFEVRQEELLAPFVHLASKKITFFQNKKHLVRTKTKHIVFIQERAVPYG